MRLDRPRLVLLLVLVLAAALYACGLPGGFVFDDYPNLAGLESIGDAPRRAAIYLTDGPASSFPRRALSYLSFLLQRSSWPNDPAAFKLVNIVLHLLNGALLYAVLSRALALAGVRLGAGIALGAVALWLVHPIQVSTVLYVVQRMTELSALLCLAALVAYLEGRRLAAEGRLRAGYAWMTAAVALGTPLSILAKENGILLPLYVAVLELTLLSRVARPPRWRAWAAIFLAVPPLALVAYLASPGQMAGYSIRDFTPAQRIYTEAGILWDYLAKIALPRPRAFGLYFDDYPVAAAPWHSAGTALAMGAWVGALGAAVLARKRFPVAAFAVLWYFAGHLLEGSVVPLELYFEHRNYLPLAGPALAAAWGFAVLWQRASSGTVRRTYAALAAAVLLAVTAVTWVEARAWSDPLRLTVFWAHERPASARAQHDLGVAYFMTGHYAEADEVYRRAQAGATAEKTQFVLARAVVACLSGDMDAPPRAETAQALSRTVVLPVVFNLLELLSQYLEQGRCGKTVDAAYAVTLVDGLLSNPTLLSPFRRGLLYMRGRLYAVQHYLDGAVRSLEAGDALQPSLMSTQLQATWLLSADLYDDALRAVLRGRDDPRWPPAQRALYAPFFEAWARQIREAAAAKGVSLGSVK